MNSSFLMNDCFLICNFINQGEKISLVIKDIQEALSHLNQGKFVLINDPKNFDILTKNGYNKLIYYKKNNNIIIEFPDNQKKSLLFMNSKENLLNLELNNIYIVDHTNYNNIFYLYDKLLSCNNKEMLNNIGGIVLFPAKSFINIYNKKLVSSSSHNNLESKNLKEN